MSTEVIGENGMLGKALMRRIPPLEEGPPAVIVAAGRVGGIKDNSIRPVDYLIHNLQVLPYIQRTFQRGITRLVYIGSSCMYPTGCRQPMRERDLWAGRLEPTNEGYAIAKLAGEALCRAYRSQHHVDYRTAILCNLYGAEDRGFKDPAKSHVIPDLIGKLIKARDEKAKSLALMGTGRAIREFMHVDDAAAGILHYLKQDKAPGTINIGTGEGITIKALVEGLRDLVGYKGAIRWNGHLDGMSRKVMDCKQIQKLGWYPRISLWEGLEKVVKEVDR